MAEERTVYLSWKSPSRLYKKRDKEFFRNIAAITFLLLIILFFAKEFPLILAVVAIVFLVYVFSTVPPDTITHTISSKGIETAEREYEWEKLKSFWFEEQWEQKIVTIVMDDGTRLTLLLGDIEADRIKDVISRFIRFYDEPQKTLVDNAASWLSKKVPLDKSS